MKKACIRIRKLEGMIGVNKDKNKTDAEIKAEEAKLIKKGYHKVFDTIKFDFQYKKTDLTSYIQLQDIKDVGLLVYWEHDIFYKLSEEEQHKQLLEELNSFGFEFKDTDLGVDKLRTLYYGKTMYSINQNG